MQLTLIRHGSIEEKYLACYNGHIDISLSELGIAQITSLRQKIEEKNYTHIYASDLKRAKQTVEALALKDVTYTNALREKSWGIHEGKSFEEIGLEYENFEQYINALDGESIEDFTNTIRNFFYTYLPQQVNDKILIITHAGVIKTLLSLHENISLEDAFSKSIPYASITRIRLENI